MTEDTGTGDSSSAVGDDNTRRAIEFLEARFASGDPDGLTVDLVLAEAIGEGVTESIDLALNTVKLYGGMVKVALLLIALRSRETGKSTTETLEFLRTFFDEG